jgi:hypothetical protein
MKRRDFVYTGAAVVAGELLASIEAAAQAAPTQPVRVLRTVDASATSANTACQDVIFDGQRFLSLYSPRGGAPATRQYSVAATTPGGDLLWHYALPKGGHVSLGTYSGMVVSIAGAYTPPSGKPVLNPVWLLDPNTGSTSSSGQADANGPLHYAGDSAFFRVVAGQGQIWSFNGALTLRQSGLAAQSFGAKFRLQDLVSTDTIAVASIDGNWLTRISVSSGTVQENAISGDFVPNVRSFYQSLQASFIARNGIDPNKVAAQEVVSAIGGDQNGGVYALIVTPKDGKGVLPVVSFEQSGNATLLGKVQLPVSPSGVPDVPLKVAVIGSEICVLTSNGDAAWYSLPAAA